MWAANPIALPATIAKTLALLNPKIKAAPSNNIVKDPKLVTGVFNISVSGSAGKFVGYTQHSKLKLAKAKLIGVTIELGTCK